VNLREPKDWEARAVDLGAAGAVLIDPRLVVTADWVRVKCQFGCDGYGQCRTCPPHSPTATETRKLLDGYARAVLLRSGPSTDESESDRLCRRLRTVAAGLERELFLAGFYKAWCMGAGPCEICDVCDMDAPCVAPEQARPSMEACGVDVFSTVRNAGWEVEVVKDHRDRYQYFSLVLVD
jgi:predicted metal-binding protein